MKNKVELANWKYQINGDSTAEMGQALWIWLWEINISKMDSMFTLEATVGHSQCWSLDGLWPSCDVGMGQILWHYHFCGGVNIQLFLG